MFKILISLCFVALALASPANHIEEDLNVKLLVVKNIEEFKKANPSIKLTKLNTQVSPLGGIRYTLGGRVSGDRLVASGGDRHSFPSAKNIQLTMRYPNSGTGAIVNFVDIQVDQSSNDGEAYVTGGGLGQNYIAFIVEAYSTTYFNYQVQVYGR